MGNLFLYGIFHANLNFSYIPEDLFPQILRRCYWPLLKIIRERKIPLGLEFSGYTLETINRLDPSFTAEVRRLWDDGLCDVIGCSYTQSILPLVPAKVNRHNLKFGNQVYQEILGHQPTIAFLNEQVFSSGIIPLLKESGYEAVVANWDSALPAHKHPENLYRSCQLACGEDDPLPIIWHCGMAYRNLQQYVEQEIPLDEFISRLETHIPETGFRAYPLYSSDWEVFDFKPWRVQPDGFRPDEPGEMERLTHLFELLENRSDMKFVLPSKVLSLYPDRDTVEPQSSAYPLTYKKQDQHSVSRWSVGGRDGIRMNTQCFRLYQLLNELDWTLEFSEADSDLPVTLEDMEQLWHELCYLWNSDFRTFTTEDKFSGFRHRMGAVTLKAEELLKLCAKRNDGSGQNLFINLTSIPESSVARPISIKSDGVGISANPLFEVELNGDKITSQVTSEQSWSGPASEMTLQKIISRGTAGLDVRQVTLAPRRNDSRRRQWRIDSENHLVKTPAVEVKFDPNLGGALDQVVFPNVSPQPLITAPVISQGLTFRNGGLELEDMNGRRASDGVATEMQYPEETSGMDLFVPVRCVITTETGTVWKTYQIYVNQPKIDVMVRFQWRDVVPRSFRIGGANMNPSAFDSSNLYYATVNGGDLVERFSLADISVDHGSPAAATVTASCCLGATEGWVVIGDDEKGVGLITHHGELYSAALVRYQPPSRNNSFHLSLTHTLGESDETSHILWRGHSTWKASILGGGQDIVDLTRTSALLANGGLVTRR